MADIVNLDSEDEAVRDNEISTNCTICNDQYAKENMPMLLSCLHTICNKCLKQHVLKASSLSENIAENDIVECPACKFNTLASEVLVNYLIVFNFLNKDEELRDEENENICTACEENEIAQNFCTDCTEWLCSVCTQAHRRVRVTKEHEIVGKELAQKKRDDAIVKELVKCSVHPRENLKLFCETCDKLTCRDCQLQEHREHKHHFVVEAIEQTKKLLLSLRSALNKKKTDLVKSKTHCETRLKKAIEDEKVISENIEQIFSTMKREIEKKEQQLTSDLKHIFEELKEQIKVVDVDYVSLGGAIDDAVQFVDSILHEGSQVFTLYTKSAVLRRAQKILSKSITPCPDNVDVRYKDNSKWLVSNIGHIGVIFKNGLAVGQHPSPPVKSQQQTLPQQPLSQMPHPPGSYSPSNQDVTRQLLLRLMKNLPAEQHKSVLDALRVTPDNEYSRHMHPMPQHYSTSSVGLSFPHQKAASASLAASLAQPLNKMNNHISGPLPRSMAYKPPPSYNHMQLRAHMEQQMQQQYAASQKYSMHHAPRPVISPGMEMRVPLSSQHKFPPTLIRAPIAPIAPFTEKDIKPLIPPWTVPAENLAKLSDGHIGGLLRGLTSNASDHSTHRSPHSNSSCEGGSRPSSRDSGINLKQEIPDSNACFHQSLPGINMGVNGGSKPKGINQDHLEAAILSVPIMSDGSSFQPCQTDIPSTSSASDSGLTDSSSPTMSMVDNSNHEYNCDDPSDDYCACCHNGGDLLCCDQCPRVYHLTCHIPNLDTTPVGCWTCLMCANDQSICITTPVSHEVSDTNKRKAPSGLTDQEMRVCERVLLELFCHEASVPFHIPVSKTVVPDYHKVVSQPMDFSKIKSKLSRQHFNQYKEIEEFLADIALVFTNCSLYNGSESEVGKSGVIVHTFAKSVVSRLLPCYINYFNSKSDPGISQLKALIDDTEVKVKRFHSENADNLEKKDI